MKKRFLAVALALVLALMCGCGDENKLPSDADIMVKVGDSTQKYERSTDISSLNFSTIEIAAAKGETEGGQFIVNANFDGESYHASASDLVCGDNKISKDNVTIHTQIYSECNEREYGGSLPSGYYPDCLIPIKYIEQAGENVLSKGVNQAFWVDVKVPRNAVAGTYSSEITFECDGIEKKVPINVKVYDFEIYEVSSLKTSYAIWEDWIFYGEHDDSKETIKKYYDLLSEYGLAAGIPDSDTAEEFVANVREYYSKLSTYRITVPRNPNVGYDYDVFKEILYLLAKACVQDNVNYFDRAYYNFDKLYDEARNSTALDEATVLINGYEEEVIEKLSTDEILSSDSEIANTIRGLRHCVTIDKLWDFSENVNFVVPKATMLEYTRDIQNYVALAQEKGFTVWTYNCIVGDRYPYYSAEINDYLFTTRENMWANYVNGFEGMLYWNTTGFCDWSLIFESGKDVYGYGLIKDLYTTACHDGRTNGDGYMVYPGSPYGSDKPFASLRLTALRDGSDDYTYMTQLNDEYNRVNASLSANPFVTYLTENIIGRNSSKLNFNATMEARESIANAIIAAKKHDFVISDISRINNVMNYEFYASATATVKLGGEVLSGAESNGLKYYKGTYDITGATDSVKVTVGETEISLPTGAKATVLIDFESENASIKTSSGAITYQEVAYAKVGKSAKVTLTGNAEDTSFKPYVYFGIFSNSFNLTDVSGIEFYVYNDSEADVEATLYLQIAENKVSSQSIYDVYILKAKSWTRVEIDNVQVLGWRENRVKSVEGFGLRIPNTENPVTLYLDELSYKGV